MGRKADLKNRNNLAQIKEMRIARLAQDQDRHILKKASRKFSELRSEGHSYFYIASLFAVKFVRKVLGKIRSFARSSHTKVSVDNIFAEDRKGFHLAINVAGGVGDALIAARFLRDLSAEVEDDIQIDVYHNFPNLVQFVFDSVSTVRSVYHAALFDCVRDRYDVSGKILCQYCTVDLPVEGRRKLIESYPKLLKILSTIEASKQKYDLFVKHHPGLDGAFSDVVAEKGLRRETILHHFANINYSSREYQLKIPDGYVSQLGLTPKSYITIHDGWDGSGDLGNRRPTKSYPLERWNELVALLKERLPGVKIVQVGGAVGGHIDGVDLSLKEKISLPEAVSVIRDGLLHVDNESGLIHLASAMGVKSVVLFGPTHYDFFSYPTNINMQSEACGNCWWSTDNWAARCPRGFSLPPCMDSISPEAVADAVVAACRAAD
ncbi:glycosyltransferase family 9 protein [Chromobacterium vaccinii]|uniref:glycosyltransferase family 9 protein n=1 Tax=Chromobacterium vaccinii TaxID=1108595 RepID=UPI003C750E5D